MMRNRAIFGIGIFVTALLMNLNAGTMSPASGEEDISDIVKKVYPSVVQVVVKNGIRKVATGVVLDKRGHIVTTALISPRDEKIYITTWEGKRLDAEFLGMDAMTHLALVKAKDGKLPPIEKGKAKDLAAGSWIGVVSISPENRPAVHRGYVSSVGEDSLRLDVWVVRGASGSPVVDEKGKMVGLLRGVYADEAPVVFEFREKEVVGSGYVFSRAEAPSSGMANAVPIDIVVKVCDEIRDKGKVERGWLGVFIDRTEDGRIEIVDVEKESPAELAGLKEGDIVLEFDGKEITSTEALAKMIRSRKPGDRVAMKVERDGKIENIRVRLGEYKESDIIQEFESKFPRLFPRPGESMIRIPKRSQMRFFTPRMEKRKFIGVYLDPLNKELSEFFGVEEGTGLLVSRLTKDGPAEKAGMKVGDVILRANGKRVETVSELSNMIQDVDKGETVEIEFLRDKKKKTLKVEVDEEESGVEYFNWNNWNDYAREFGDYVNKVKVYTKDWSDRAGKLYEQKAEKFSREMEKLAEEAAAKAKQRSEDTERLLKQTLRKYKGIRV